MGGLKKFWLWLQMSWLGDIVWFIFHIPSIIANSEFVQRTLGGDFTSGTNYHANRSSIVSGKLIFGLVCLGIGLTIGYVL